MVFTHSMPINCFRGKYSLSDAQWEWVTEHCVNDMRCYRFKQFWWTLSHSNIDRKKFKRVWFFHWFKPIVGVPGTFRIWIFCALFTAIHCSLFVFFADKTGYWFRFHFILLSYLASLLFGCVKWLRRHRLR